AHATCVSMSSLISSESFDDDETSERVSHLDGWKSIAALRTTARSPHRVLEEPSRDAADTAAYEGEFKCIGTDLCCDYALSKLASDHVVLLSRAFVFPPLWSTTLVGRCLYSRCLTTEHHGSEGHR